MNIIIRQAQAGDLPSLTALMHDYVVGFYNNPWPGDPTIQRLIHTLLEQQIGIQFVAEQEGTLIGFSTLYFTYSTMRAERTTIMNDLFVVEKHRSGEAEVMLFERSRHYTREQGCAYMSWITSVTNVRAQQLFDRLGAKRGDWVNYSIT